MAAACCSLTSAPVIAFAWRGNPEHKVDGARSAKLEDMAPLAAIENVTLVCLQHNATDEEIAACGFADRTGREAVIGSLDDIAAIVQGSAGTRVVPSPVPAATGRARPAWGSLEEWSS